MDVPSAISKVLDDLSARFGATGAHLWGVYVNYIFAQGLAQLVMGVLLIVIAITLYFKLDKIHTFLKIAASERSDTPLVVTWIVAIAATILLLISLIGLPDNITQTFAPEGAAIAQIISTAQSK